MCERELWEGACAGCTCCITPGLRACKRTIIHPLADEYGTQGDHQPLALHARLGDDGRTLTPLDNNATHACLTTTACAVRGGMRARSRHSAMLL